MSPSPSRRALLAALGAALAGCTGASDDRGSPTTPSPIPPDETPTTSAPSPPTGTPAAPVRFRVSVESPVVYPPAVAGDTVYVAAGESRPTPTPDGSPDRVGTLLSLGTGAGTERWRVSLPDPPTGRPAVRPEGGALLVTGWNAGTQGVDQRLRAYVEGAERWTSGAVGQYRSLLAVDGGRVYTATSDDAIDVGGQTLSAFGTGDGDRLWSVTAGDAWRGWRHGDSLLVDYGGLALAAHDPRTGERRFRARGEALTERDGTLPVTDGVAFLATDADRGERFTAVGLADGRERWSYAADGGGPFVPTGGAAAADTAVGVEYGGLVFGVDPADGRERWTFETAGETRDPPVADEGTVYVADGSGTVYALDAVDGTEQWRAGTGSVDELRAADGVLVALDRSGGVRALDATDGDERWSFDAGARLTAPVIADGTVYVADGSGTVYALSD